MLKVTTNFTEEPTLIKAKDMKPMQIGIVRQESMGDVNGHIVMRTQTSGSFELMDLSRPRPDSCWSIGGPSFMVELLKDGQSITLSQTT
tara:strand:- start:186 stop:452 length:267 start_codon:yes stop_codon:yes gene_type:complete